MKADLDRVKMENQYLRDRAVDRRPRPRARHFSGAIAVEDRRARNHRQRPPDRRREGGHGRPREQQRRSSKGMAVMTPDGIVGKVIERLSDASFVLLVTDPDLRRRRHLAKEPRAWHASKARARRHGIIDYVQNEEKVDQGEWFYTSGDDRIFPKGLPVGRSDHGAARERRQGDLRDAQRLSEWPGRSADHRGRRARADSRCGRPAVRPVHLLAPPPADDGGRRHRRPSHCKPVLYPPTPIAVEEQYRKIGEAQNHVYGERGNGAPNYNAPPGSKPPEAKPENKP